MPVKKRLDVYLVEQGLAPSRQRAQAMILAGVVSLNGQMARTVAAPVVATDRVEVRQPDHPYVSRGGLKLAHALETFGISVDKVVALDIGASTGGFTDCLLKAGAAKVYALDVGYGQLDWRLRNDERVKVIERVNIRHWAGEEIEAPPRCVVIDVSFISLRKVLPPVEVILEKCAPGQVTLIVLIKPQFEVGREAVGSGGIVRDQEAIQVVLATMEQFVRDRGWSVMGITASPILGAKGNQEYLMAAQKSFGNKLT